MEAPKETPSSGKGSRNNRYRGNKNQKKNITPKFQTEFTIPITPQASQRGLNIPQAQQIQQQATNTEPVSQRSAAVTLAVPTMPATDGFQQQQYVPPSRARHITITGEAQVALPDLIVNGALNPKYKPTPVADGQLEVGLIYSSYNPWYDPASDNTGSAPASKHILHLKTFTPEQKAAVERIADCPPASFHEVLDITRTATQNDIKAAYRTLSLLTHPDKNGCDGADEAFKRVNEAYLVMLARCRLG